MGDGGFQFLDILLLGAIAGFIALRLRAVLGLRTGHEQRRRPPFGGPEGEGEKPGADERDNVIALPRREADADRKSTRLNFRPKSATRMTSSGCKKKHLHGTSSQRLDLCK